MEGLLPRADEIHHQREGKDVGFFIVVLVPHNFWSHVTPTSNSTCHGVVLRFPKYFADPEVSKLYVQMLRQEKVQWFPQLPETKYKTPLVAAV